jgi:hypothetical protein
MCRSKYSRTLIGLVFAGVFAIAATPGARAQGAQTQGAQSWCVSGSDLYACGFASFEQCELARDGVGMCVANGRPPEPSYVEADRMYRAATANAMLDRNANARLVGPMRKHRAR